MSGSFDLGVIARSLPYLWQGMRYTLGLMAAALAGGMAIGTLLAMARLSNLKGLSLAAKGYVNLMRSVPLILVLFWFYFMVPLLLQWIMRTGGPVSVGPEVSAYVTFVLFEAAYFCEIVRAGIKSVPRGQIYASQALGLNYLQTMRFVVLPRAFRNVLPVLITQAIVLFQDTSLVYVISATDFMGAASKIAQRDHRLTEMYVFAGLVYLVICFTASHFVQRLRAHTYSLNNS